MANPLQDNLDRVVRRSELLGEHYVDSDNETHKYPVIGQGPATRADADDLARDELGFTHPNLHRRIMNPGQTPPIAENPLDQEVAPRNYKLQIQNVHSYRTTQINVHDEDSIDSEIP